MDQIDSIQISTSAQPIPKGGIPLGFKFQVLNTPRTTPEEQPSDAPRNSYRT
ncbi:hypothetical protein T11_8176, partial [Trichinella zimbabwensis]